MKLKKILSIILVCCMLLTVLSLTACKGGDDDTDGDKTDNNGTDNNNNNEQTGNKTYTVTIVDGDNNPVEGVRLVITDGKTFPTVTTGYEGKATECSTLATLLFLCYNSYTFFRKLCFCKEEILWNLLLSAGRNSL